MHLSEHHAVLLAVALHFFNEEVVGGVKLATKVVVSVTCLATIAGCLVDLFEDHPKLSTVLNDFDNFFLGKELELVPESNFVIFVHPQVVPS